MAGSNVGVRTLESVGAGGNPVTVTGSAFKETNTLVGTVSVTAGKQEVTGSGTAFITVVAKGDVVDIDLESNRIGTEIVDAAFQIHSTLVVCFINSVSSD